MADLITLDIAKQHLRVDTDDEDNDISLKIKQASAVIVSYCASNPDAQTWDADTVPFDAQIACLLLVAQFSSVREAGDFTSDAANYLPTSVMALLSRLRDPALGAPQASVQVWP